MRNLSNVSIREFRKILKKLGLVKSRNKGGHEQWSKPGMIRPITFAPHTNPMPEYVVHNNIRILGITKEEFINLLENL